MTQIVEKSHLLGATLLITGACVGGGMLGLPVVTADTGFFPSLLLLFICWIFMATTGLLLVEANLWMEEGAHLMTMASRLLGRTGKFLSILVYIFMGYASLVAYNAGGGILIQDAVNQLFGLSLGIMGACSLFAALFGTMLYFGTKILGRINGVLTIGLLITYFGLLYTGLGGVRASEVMRQSWAPAPFAFPLIIASFSFQMMLPSLTGYLKRDPRSMRFAVLAGTSIPFLIYVMWQLVILGTIPYEGAGGLGQLADGEAVTTLLRNFVTSPAVSRFADTFAFFALVTSYLGISLGLIDFMGDVVSAKKRGIHRRLLWAAVVIPSLIFAIVKPDIFIDALEVSGGFGDTLLSALIPISMVWVGRYVKHMEGPYQMKGGKQVLILLAAFAIYVFTLQVIKLS